MRLGYAHPNNLSILKSLDNLIMKVKSILFTVLGIMQDVYNRKVKNLEILPPTSSHLASFGLTLLIY